MTTWTKESIQSLLAKSDKAVIRAMLAIQSFQTLSEQSSHTTKDSNGVGWSAFDAPFMGDMIVAFRRYGRLTPKQMAVTRNKVMRYHRQLVEIANAKEAAKVPTIERASAEPEVDAAEAEVTPELDQARMAHEEALFRQRRTAEWRATVNPGAWA